MQDAKETHPFFGSDMSPSQLRRKFIDSLLHLSGLLRFIIASQSVLVSLHKVWQCIRLGFQNSLRLRNVFQTGRVLFAQLTELCASQEELEEP